MNETIDKMKKFFASDGAYRNVLQGSCEEFNRVWQGMYSDILRMKNDEDATTPRDSVLDTVVRMRRWLAFEQATKNQVEFFKDFALLIHEWNNSSIKDPNISIECRNVSDVAEGNLSMRDVTEIMKKVSQRLQDMQSWNPPAFEISKSYVDYLGDKESK